MPSATLPKLTDHAPFAPIAARMVALNVAAAQARRDLTELVQRHHARRPAPASDGGSRFGGDESFDAKYAAAERAVETTKEAAQEYARTTYRAAFKEAWAAVRPMAAREWQRAVVTVSAAADKYRQAVAAAREVKAGLEAGDAFHLPLVDPLPADDLFGDPADAWSVSGKLRAAVRDLEPPTPAAA